MLLSCPYCETQFQIDAVALGEHGRKVRCARCRGSWFAEPVLEMAETAAEEGDSFASPPAETESGWDEETSIAETESPPLAAEQAPEIAIESGDRPVIQPETKPAGRSFPVRNLNRMKNYRIPRPLVLAFVLLGLSVTALGSRTSIVRIMPNLAGVYAAIGLPVNLRGLEFRDVKTIREMQDGIPVLVIEGEVVNVVRHPVEVPRVRLAVLGPDGQELYSWTTLLPRSILGDGEKVSFRSRLASPPPEGREVLVRFLTRGDLTAR